MTAANLSIGADAPDFDLTSTEDVLLMLRDEVPRTAVVLYVFLDIDDSTRSDLEALATEAPAWVEQGIRVLAMAPVKVAKLKQLQAELHLPFPLLEDDRDFAARYGVEAPPPPPEPDEESGEGDDAKAEVAEPVDERSAADFIDRRLVLVDRDCKVAWHSDPTGGLGGALSDLKKSPATKQARLSNYPGQVINKLVNWWVN